MPTRLATRSRLVLLVFVLGMQGCASKTGRFWEDDSDFARTLELFKLKTPDGKAVEGYHLFVVKQALGPPEKKIKALGCKVSYGTKYYGIAAESGALIVPPHYREIEVFSGGAIYGRPMCGPTPAPFSWPSYQQLSLTGEAARDSGIIRFHELDLGPEYYGRYGEADRDGWLMAAVLLRPDGREAFRLPGLLADPRQPVNFRHFSIEDTRPIEGLPGGVILAHHQEGAGKSQRRLDILYDRNGLRISPPLPPLVRLPGGSPGTRLYAVPLSDDGLVWPVDSMGGLLPLPDDVVGVRPLIARKADVARGTRKFEPRKIIMSGGVLMNDPHSRPPPFVPRWIVKDEDQVVAWLALRQTAAGRRWVLVQELNWLQAGIPSQHLVEFEDVRLIDDSMVDWSHEALAGWESLDPVFIARRVGQERYETFEYRHEQKTLTRLVPNAFPEVPAAEAWLASYAEERKRTRAAESARALERQRADPVWQAEQQRQAARLAEAKRQSQLYELQQQVSTCVAQPSLCSMEKMRDLLRQAPAGTAGYAGLRAYYDAANARNEAASQEYADRVAEELANDPSRARGCILCLPDNPLAHQRDIAWKNYSNGIQGWYINEKGQYVNPRQ